MCNECLQNPCVSACPNCPTPKAIFVCSICQYGIVEGDDYYDFEDVIVCDECLSEYVKNYRKTAVGD